jgi:hypothetical protein
MVYRLRVGSLDKRSNEHTNYEITVPPEVGTKFAGRLFVCSLTEDGILYRLFDDTAASDMPSWMTDA